MKREDGFYWVKINGDWMVAELINDCWFACGNDFEYSESEIEQIGEQIKKPE